MIGSALAGVTQQDNTMLPQPKTVHRYMGHQRVLRCKDKIKVGRVSRAYMGLNNVQRPSYGVRRGNVSEITCARDVQG